MKQSNGNAAPLRKGVRPIRILPLGYLSIIAIGTLLLMLPAASREGALSFFEALFTATSASCVTGLVVVDTGSRFTLFGQGVILTLIQLGGLGFMTLATVLFGLTGKKISLRGRLTAGESIGEDGLGDVPALCRRAAIYTLACEGVGAVLLSIRFIGLFGPAKGVWYGVFHSVSAFCNAGFDLIGGFRSLTPYGNDPLVCLTVCALIITGGIGFAVIYELGRPKKPSGLSLHTRVVLLATGGLLLLGFLVTLAVEWANPATLGPLTLAEKLHAALFQSVTLRTAGFNTIDQAGLRDASKLFACVMMFIGGAPAGTAGGVKVTTVAVLFLTVRAFLQNNEETVAFGRRLSPFAVRRALCVFFIGLLLILLTAMGISISEGDSLPFLDILYETASALGTVGLSVGVTAAANTFSRALLCLLMYLGRAGILTIALAIGGKTDEPALRYPEGNIMIG